MVKKVDWRVSQTINTSSAARKYLDLCKDWIVAMDVEEKIEDNKFCNMPVQSTQKKGPIFGLFETELRNCKYFECALCTKECVNNENGKSITANPFTRCQYMLVCNDCYELDVLKDG